MGEPHLLYQVESHIAIITLNRPEAKNGEPLKRLLKRMKAENDLQRTLFDVILFLTLLSVFCISIFRDRWNLHYRRWCHDG